MPEQALNICAIAKDKGISMAIAIALAMVEGWAKAIAIALAMGHWAE